MENWCDKEKALKNHSVLCFNLEEFGRWLDEN